MQRLHAAIRLALLAVSVACAGGFLAAPPAGAAAATGAQPVTEVVLLDPTNGQVVSATPTLGLGLLGWPAGANPDISIANGCDAGWGCYETDQSGYSDYGFYGSSGTYHGSWPYRSGFYTGDYSAFACWTGKCSSTYPPGTYVGFTSDVTGTAFWIS
jgi:hypothetical protein